VNPLILPRRNKSKEAKLKRGRLLQNLPQAGERGGGEDLL